MTREDKVSAMLEEVATNVIQAMNREKLEPKDTLLITCALNITQELVELNRTMKLIQANLFDLRTTGRDRP